jgi:hypothetical protein
LNFNSHIQQAPLCETIAVEIVRQPVSKVYKPFRPRLSQKNVCFGRLYALFTLKYTLLVSFTLDKIIKVWYNKVYKFVHTRRLNNHETWNDVAEEYQ